MESFYDLLHKENTSVVILPTLHDQLQFSQLASRLLKQFQFDEVLVELPVEMEEVLKTAIDRLPLVTIVHDGRLQLQGDHALVPPTGSVFIVHPGESLYWTAFEARRSGTPVTFTDRWHPQALQTWQVPLVYEHLAAVGWTTFWDKSDGLVKEHLSHQIHLARSRHMGQQVASTGEGRTLLVVVGAAHWPAVIGELRLQNWEGDTMVPERIIRQYMEKDPVWNVPSPRTWKLADVHPHSIHLVTGQLPYYIGSMVEDPNGFEMMEAVRQLYFNAEKNYTRKFDDQISPASYRRMFQYLRNLGRLQGMVLPDLYNLVAAAKGMGDGDFAFEVYRVSISYPFLPAEDQKLEDEFKFVPDESQGEVIRFAFRRRIKRPVLKKVDRDEFDDLDPIPDEEYPGQWQEIWEEGYPYGYVSYPPEDEFIENYMHYLRKRIVEILMEEESSTMEFESSLEDGIDWRETMRHFHEGKIFVRKYPKNRFQVGALVIQFLEEPLDTSEYSHHSTLFAEHDQESHISVITTEPGEVIVGPGISRVKYAAIISQFPPTAMPYLIPRQNTDLKLRLIWTAMNMSLNNIIGFVAKKPPTAAQRHFAAEEGFRLVFLPMGQLTSESLRRLRTMHLLAHRDLRDIAREYIGF